jgi:CheY-like chemotaxis protein
MNSNKNLKNLHADILIIDDDKDDHFFLNEAIKEIIPDWETKSLFDGVEAIDYFFGKDRESVHLPRLIFMDLNMTKLSGLETVSLMRKDKRLDAIPIIILTTAGKIEFRKQLAEVGANDFYTKPCSLEGLKKIVSDVLKKWFPKGLLMVL